MNDNIKMPDQDSEMIKVRMRKRRKRGLNSAIVMNESLKDEIIFSKSQHKMGFKKVPTFMATDNSKIKINVMDENGMFKSDNGFESENSVISSNYLIGRNLTN